MRGYAMTRWKQNNNAHRVPYDLTSNSCLHFMKQTADAGGAQLPNVYLDTPTGYMLQIQLQRPDLEFRGPGTLTLEDVELQ